MKKELIATACISLIVLLFVYTSASKFLDYPKFVFQLRLAPLPMMITLAPVIGWLVPLAELLVPLGLLTEKYRLKALFATVALLILFEFYITAMLLTGKHLPCTCGGIISTLGWKQHLLFNALFILIAVTAICIQRPFLRKKQAVLSPGNDGVT
jgi:putative oxidoreductase